MNNNQVRSNIGGNKDEFDGCLEHSIVHSEELPQESFTKESTHEAFTKDSPHEAFTKESPQDVVHQSKRIKTEDVSFTVTKRQRPIRAVKKLTL